MVDYYSIKTVGKNTICFNSVSARSDTVQFHNKLGNLF